MKQRSDRSYSSATLEKDDLVWRLGKKDVNSFNNSIHNIKEMITHFKHKNHKLKKKFKNFKMITTIIKSFDRLGTIAITSSSITLSPTGIGLIAIPISSSIACGLTISNKINYELVMQKYTK